MEQHIGKVLAREAAEKSAAAAAGRRAARSNDMDLSLSVRPIGA
jgi:hypothetical protein